MKNSIAILIDALQPFNKTLHPSLIKTKQKSTIQLNLPNNKGRMGVLNLTNVIWLNYFN